MYDPNERIIARHMERGYYGSDFGSGESPYTSFWPVYAGRELDGESPYTSYGRQPGLQRMRPVWLSPYTRFMPVYEGRRTSGESPYTDFGPLVESALHLN